MVKKESCQDLRKLNPISGSLVALVPFGPDFREVELALYERKDFLDLARKYYCSPMLDNYRVIFYEKTQKSELLIGKDRVEQYKDFRNILELIDKNRDLKYNSTRIFPFLFYFDKFDKWERERGTKSYFNVLDADYLLPPNFKSITQPYQLFRRALRNINIARSGYGYGPDLAIRIPELRNSLTEGFYSLIKNHEISAHTNPSGYESFIAGKENIIGWAKNAELYRHYLPVLEKINDTFQE
jgi:hypothetical protein